MARTDYIAKITYCSKELTAKERIMLKDLTDCTQLDECEGLVIEPDFFATLDIHNEHSKDTKDYSKTVIVSKQGEKYITGSQAFANALSDILDEVADSDEEFEWAIKVIKKPSKNYNGSFLTCTII